MKISLSKGKTRALVSKKLIMFRDTLVLPFITRKGEGIKDKVEALYMRDVPGKVINRFAKAPQLRPEMLVTEP